MRTDWERDSKGQEWRGQLRVQNREGARLSCGGRAVRVKNKAMRRRRTCSRPPGTTPSWWSPVSSPTGRLFSYKIAFCMELTFTAC